MRHELIDRDVLPRQLAVDRRMTELEARISIQERRGESFDAVIATIRVQALVLGVLVTAFGSAILFKLGVI